MASINTGMPRISRNMDHCRTGHSRCTRTAPCEATQYQVFANNRAILRRGDPVKPHIRPKGRKKCKRHSPRVIGSSRSVFVGNIGVARRDDRADAGEMIHASFNVFANGF